MHEFCCSAGLLWSPISKFPRELNFHCTGVHIWWSDAFDKYIFRTTQIWFLSSKVGQSIWSLWHQLLKCVGCGHWHGCMVTWWSFYPYNLSMVMVELYFPLSQGNHIIQCRLQEVFNLFCEEWCRQFRPNSLVPYLWTYSPYKGQQYSATAFLIWWCQKFCPFQNTKETK